jgi:hypothetical protein
LNTGYYELECKESQEQITMAYMFPSIPRKIHPALFKQKIVRAAMKSYWPLRMAGFDYLLAPIIL